jgi:hypothetical protein
MIRRSTLALALGLMLVAGGCGDETTGPSSSTGPMVEPSSAPHSLAHTSKTTCPSAFTGEPGRSICKIAEIPVRLSRCNDAGPGGYDVRVSGISCEVGRDLRLPLGNGFSGYGHSKERVYRPWTASGPLGHLEPKRPTGWTCWAGFDPHGSQGIWHVCWRGSGLLLFKSG